jgi:hypothetical protein
LRRFKHFILTIDRTFRRISAAPTLSALPACGSTTRRIATFPKETFPTITVALTVVRPS